MYEFGDIKIRLQELLEEHELSKSKLSQQTGMQRLQIKKYCNNTITRLDIDVLARLCHVFNCNIEDLLVYVPPQDEYKQKAE